MAYNWNQLKQLVVEDETMQHVERMVTTVSGNIVPASKTLCGAPSVPQDMLPLVLISMIWTTPVGIFVGIYLMPPILQPLFDAISSCF